MDARPLAVSPLAKFLLSIAERRATGSVRFGDRVLVVANAEVHDVLPAAQDPDLGAFLIASGRASQEAVEQARVLASQSALPLEDAIVQVTSLGRADLRSQKRALWLDRWVRALRLGLERKDDLPTFGGESLVSDGSGVPLLSFVLDGFARLAVDADASVVGMHINHRLTWLDGPLREDAQRWAAFGTTAERPVISSVLAKSPAVAPQIAALARAGLVRLDSPGTPGARTKSRTGTLPPPPPRLSMLPAAPPASLPASSVRPPAPQGRAPRLRLDPGADGIPVEAIPVVQLVVPPVSGAPLTLVDPLREIELRIATLEERAAPGPERARAFMELARLWQTRIGSLEEAARALREAAAADPNDTRVLSEAALHCSYLGRVDLGVAYAQTAIAATPISVERAAAYRLLSDIYRAADDTDGCIEALSEAAAEDASNPEAHELLAHLLAERDNLPIAVAHARFAALGWLEHDDKRAAMLYAMAYAWNPSDALLSEEYANLLHTLGHTEAALAVVAETARNTDDPELRRRVRFTAAQRAQASGRRDLSAELLLQIFDDEPDYELPYGPLDEDLNRTGSAARAEHAAVIESIAQVCPEGQRAAWWTRAGEILLGAPGMRDDALRFLARAHALRPDAPRLRAALEEGAVSAAELERVGPGDDARLAVVESQLMAASTEAEEVSVLAELAGLRAARADHRGVVSAALRLLAIDGRHVLTAARLWRATSKLRDPALQREALTLRARAQETPRERGRALAALCRQLEDMGEYDSAMASADAALNADETAADAAIVVLRHAHRLEAGRATHLLGRARTLLGDSPPLLFSLSQAALAAGENATYIAALHDFCELAPLLPEPRLQALAFHITQHDPRAILEDAEALLRDAGGPLAVARVKEAADKLAELGSFAEAASLAQRALDERGQIDASYASRALAFAQASRDPSMITVALERCASAETGEARLLRLIDIADHHANLGDHVAELRALLRVLAMDTTCERALHGLTDLFTRSGDDNRLITMLMLALDATTDPSARRAQLLELAARAARAGDADARERAAGFLGALMIESSDDRGALLHALGALFSLGETPWAIAQAKRLALEVPGDGGGAIYLWLARKAETDLGDSKLALELASDGARAYPSLGELLLMVERLTLTAKDEAAVLSVYRSLIDTSIGPHGQRALHYRAGRWLERAGSPKEALTHYMHAFELAKGAGVAYKAIERVTRATGQLPALLDIQEELAETFRDADARLAILQEAARLALNELDDPARGFRLLMKADELAEIGVLNDALVDAAHRMGTRERNAEAVALGAIASTWEERAGKYWDADTKAKLLVHAARVHLLERRDTDASLRSLEAALVSEVSANLSPDMHVSTLCAQAETLAHAGREDAARESIARALELAPDNARALELRGRWGTVKPAPIPSVHVTAIDTPPAPPPGPRTSAPPAATLELLPPSSPVAEAASAELRDAPAATSPAAVVEIPPPPPPPPSAATGASFQLSPPSTALDTHAEAANPELFPPPMAESTAPVEATTLEVAPPPPPVAPRERTAVTALEFVPAAVAPPTPAAVAPAATRTAPRRAVTAPGIALPPAAPRPAPVASPAVSPDAAREAQLRTRAEAGDNVALRELAALASRDPNRRAETHYLVGKLARAEPQRVEALRQLHAEASAVGAQAEANVCAEILALFDPTVTPQRHGAFHAGLLHGESLTRLIDPETPRDVRRLLALLWDNTRSIPRFRRQLDAYDVTVRQRASVATDVPPALAFAQASRLFARSDTPLYLKPRAQPALTVVPTHPPAIIARSDLAAAPALTYRMAQSLIWADPEHAVVCVLAELEGRELLSGLLGAFGPKEASADLSRSAKEVASALWHTVPMRMQAQMRDIIHAHYAALDYDALRRASILASHRAAAFVIGDARVALETVASLETAPALDDIHSEDGFRFACTSSEAFTTVVRTTLSETYLSLTAQVL